MGALTSPPHFGPGKPGPYSGERGEERWPRCPACGKAAVGLEVRDGGLFARTVRITGWVCGCGKVVHWGKREGEK